MSQPDADIKKAVAKSLPLLQPSGHLFIQPVLPRIALDAARRPTNPCDHVSLDTRTLPYYVWDL
jgi:hypothetical protein